MNKADPKQRDHDVNFDPQMDRCPEVDLTDDRLRETLTKLAGDISRPLDPESERYDPERLLCAHKLAPSNPHYRWPPEFLDDDEALTLPVRIKDFRQITPVKRGRHAYLCLAFDERLGRNVALKFARVDDDGVPFDLTHEIEALGRVNDDRVVKLLQVVQHDGRKIPVLEWIDGWSIDQWITKEPIDVKEAAAIACEVARGLESIASVGLVHRDIKPSNLMLTRRGGVKIVDLGTAMEPKVDSTHATPHDLAFIQAVCGTPQYMAPEQLRNSQQVDYRADLFSLGITLIELLSGNRPTHRNTDQVRIVSDRKCESEIRHLLPKTAPSELGDLAVDLTRSRPHARIGDLAELIARLKPYADQVELRDLADRLAIADTTIRSLAQSDQESPFQPE